MLVTSHGVRWRVLAACACRVRPSRQGGGTGIRAAQLQHRAQAHRAVCEEVPELPARPDESRRAVEGARGLGVRDRKELRRGLAALGPHHFDDETDEHDGDHNHWLQQRRQHKPQCQRQHPSNRHHCPQQSGSSGMIVGWHRDTGPPGTLVRVCACVCMCTTCVVVHGAYHVRVQLPPPPPLLLLLADAAAAPVAAAAATATAAAAAGCCCCRRRRCCCCCF